MFEFRVQINSLTLHGARTNNGRPPLVMLHGVTRRWATFLPVIPALAQRCDVFAPDFRGHGKSSRADSYFVTDYARDIVEFVRQQFDRPVILYGHSLGAMAAAAAAAELGDSAQAVVMEDPPMQTMGQQISENILHSFFTGLGRFAGDTRSVPVIAADLAEIILNDPQNNRTIRLGDIRDAVQLRFTAASLKRVDPKVFTSILAGTWLKGLDVRSIFSSIRCPALLIQADRNAGGMLTDADAAQLKRLTADLTHVTLSDVGHVIHIAATQQLISLTSGFLESLT